MDKILAYMFLMLEAFFVFSWQPLLMWWGFVWAILALFFWYRPQIVKYIRSIIDEIINWRYH